MDVLIQNYRGIDILFNADNERFSYKFDLGGWSEKQSFAACKKSIDDFLKNNATFEPFVVREIRSGKTLKITGIRKDNRFVYDTGKSKEQISEYSEGGYIEYDEAQEKNYATIAVLELQIDEIKEQISEVRKLITGKSLKELKSKYVMSA
jgi:hypothetical protein